MNDTLTAPPTASWTGEYQSKRWQRREPSLGELRKQALRSAVLFTNNQITHARAGDVVVVAELFERFLTRQVSA